MVCTKLQYIDTSKDVVVYGDQGISIEEHEKATYGDLTNTQSKEEDAVKCTVAQQANDSMMLERKRRQLNENDPNQKSENYNQSDAPMINESTSEVQGPADDDIKNESQKTWTIEMLTNNGNISTNTMNEAELMSDDEKLYLYARAVHSNHLIQYHMHQIMEQQRVVNEYRNMMME